MKIKYVSRRRMVTVWRPTLKIGKTLPVLRKQRKRLNREIARFVDEAQQAHNNIDFSDLGDFDTGMWAEDLANSVKRIEQLNDLLGDVEEAIEALES